MSRHPRFLSASGPPLLLALLGGMPVLPALAGPADALQVYAGIAYFHDDNLFRLAEDRPAFGGQRGDSARQGIAGLLFDHTYGRQRLQFQAKLTKVAFSHFEQLDYDGKDFLAQLDWQLGNRVDGKAGASYAQTLAPYTDFLSSERNLRVQKRAYVDGGWRLHPSWRVRAGASRDKFSYALAVQRYNNRTEDALEAGLDYTPRSGSTAGVVLRRLKGDYLNRRLLSGAPVDDSFEQDEVKARVVWRFTEISSLQLLAGHARRKHAGAGTSAGDAGGFNGRLTANLNPRAKLRVNAAAWREFAALESNLVAYSLNSGLSTGVGWDASGKLRFDATAQSERRRYQGLLAANFPGKLSDRLRQASATATWTVRPTIQLSASLSQQRRSGAPLLGNGSFKSNTVALNASAQF